jgi:Ca2+-binding RTX toxin-like protein
MTLRSIRALVGATVALLVVAGSPGPSSAQGAPTLQLSPSTVAVGQEFDADYINCDRNAVYFFDIVNGGELEGADQCSVNFQTGNLEAGSSFTGPSTPGQYQVVVKDQQFNVVASATLTVTGADPGPSPGDICAQAIAEAGTGAGTYGRYKLVQAPAKGRAGNDVVVGTAGDDVLVGGSGNDVLCGLDGDDVLLGGSGNDHLDGGPDIDALTGGSGNDTVINGEIND